MRFAQPHFLWLLLVLPPVLGLFFWWVNRERQKLMAQFIDSRLLAGLLSGWSPARRKLRQACTVAAVVFLILALARPQWGYDQQEIKLRGLDIVVAVDTSKSMLAEDITPNRLTRAKLAALELMQTARTGRMGLVAFAGGAFLQCPLTADDTAFQQSVDALDVNIIPQGGTDLADAINTADTAFKEGDSHRVLVLMTDGEDHDGGAVEAAKQAAKNGLKIFTIGIGTTAGDLLNPNLVRDENGNAVKSHLNEKLLQDIASATGGFYLPLRGAKTIETLYQNGLAPLPKADQATQELRRYHERYRWPLAAALLLLLAEMLLPERKRSRRRSKTATLAPATTAAALLLLAWLPLSAHASPAGALKDYRAGKFAAAEKEYERLATLDKTGDLRLTYNAGAAAYRATNYDAAIKHFTVVLAAPDVKLQQAAYYNLGNVYFQQGRAAKDLDGMQESWETAVKFFQSAVKLDPKDGDAQHNLTLVKNLVAKILELREAARQAKAAADAATRERNYHHAVEIMESLLQQNPTAKQFQEFTKKLKDIDEIITPSQIRPKSQP